MAKNNFTFTDKYMVFTEDGDTLIFDSKTDIRDYFGVSAKQLANWINQEGDDWPDGVESGILEAIYITRKAPAKPGRPAKQKEVYHFRHSYDGDRWQWCDQLFSTKEKLVEYLEAFLADEMRLEEDAIGAISTGVSGCSYAKWVDPKNKESKDYVKMEPISLDKKYFGD